MRRGALLAVALVALASRWPAAARRPEPGAGAATGERRAARARARLLPQRRPRRHLRRAGRRRATRRRGSTSTSTPPPDPSAPLKLLRAGRADVAISYEPELLLARDQGADDLVAVGALVQKPLTSLMALSASEACGRRRTCAASASGRPASRTSRAYLKTILDAAGVDPGSVKETNVGFNLVPAMLSGKVDATLGAFWNYEGVDLQRRGKRPADPAHGAARRADLRRARLRRPAAATSTSDGALEAAPLPAGHGARATRCCATTRAAASTRCCRPTRAWTAGSRRPRVKATLPVFFPADAERPFGWQDAAAWAGLRATGCSSNKLLKRAAERRRRR